MRENKEVTTALTSNLRSSHFNLGNSGPETASSMKSNFIEHQLSPALAGERERLIKKNREANFCFGPNDKGKLNSQTTYNQTSHNTKPEDYLQKNSNEIDAKKTNIKNFDSKFGNVESEAASKFTEYQNQDVQR